MWEEDDMTSEKSHIPLLAETRKRTFLSSIRAQPLKPEEFCTALAYQ